MTTTTQRDETVHLAELDVSVRRAGTGRPILLLHGFPHTKDVWQAVTPVLVAAGYQVLAPDLRGVGATGVTAGGYDAATLAEDQTQLLDALGLPAAHVVGFDFGAAPAFAMATGHPDRVLSLTIVEAVVSGLAGAEAFQASGGPWWFGFHQAPGGLAEDVVAASAERYVRFFLDIGSRAGVPEDLAARIVAAYTGRDRLRAAFEHYRAMPTNAAANRAWAEHGSLQMPVTAVGAGVVGDAVARQLERVAADFDSVLLPDAGHIVPVDAPGLLAEAIIATVAR
jgi:pimeloyl-ACP methyl ester carboxylesterase